MRRAGQGIPPVIPGIAGAKTGVLHRRKAPGAMIFRTSLYPPHPGLSAVARSAKVGLGEGGRGERANQGSEVLIFSSSLAR